MLMSTLMLNMRRALMKYDADNDDDDDDDVDEDDGNDDDNKHAV